MNARIDHEEKLIAIGKIQNRCLYLSQGNPLTDTVRSALIGVPLADLLGLLVELDTTESDTLLAGGATSLIEATVARIGQKLPD